MKTPMFRNSLPEGNVIKLISAREIALAASVAF